MPRTKLVLDGTEFKKLPAAAKLAGVTIGEAFKAASEIHVEVTFRDPNQLYKLGQYSSTISDEEIKAFDRREAEKKAKQEAKKLEPIQK